MRLDRGWDESLDIRSDHDLSNRKLAENQTELSRQISELRSVVEMQGAMIQRLVDMLEGGVRRDSDVLTTGSGGVLKGKERDLDSNGHTY